MSYILCGIELCSVYICHDFCRRWHREFCLFSFGLTEYIMFMADVMHIKEVSSFLVKGELPSMVDLLPTFMDSSRLTIHFGTHI